MFRKSLVATCLAIGAAWMLCGAEAHGAIVAFQGPTLTDDNTLLQGFSADDNRGGLTLPDGPGGSSGDLRRMILRFNLSSLAGQTIIGASLQLTKGGGDGTFTNGTININRIFGTNAGWIEGSQTDLAGADTGLSTWTGALHGSVNWVNSGGTGNFPGLGAPGEGYASPPVGSFLGSSSDPVGTVKTITFSNVSFIQNWVDNPSQNAGFILIAADFTGTWRPYNSEFGTAASQPILFVETQFVPEPSTFALLGLGVVGLATQARRRRRA